MADQSETTSRTVESSETPSTPNAKLKKSVKALETAEVEQQTAQEKASELRAKAKKEQQKTEQVKLEMQAIRQEKIAKDAERRQKEVAEKATQELFEFDLVRKLDAKSKETLYKLDEEATSGSITPEQIDEKLDQIAEQLKVSLFDIGNPVRMLWAWQLKQDIESKKTTLKNTIEGRITEAETAVEELGDLANIEVGEDQTVGDLVQETVQRYGRGEETVKAVVEQIDDQETSQQVVKALQEISKTETETPSMAQTKAVEKLNKLAENSDIAPILETQVTSSDAKEKFTELADTDLGNGETVGQIFAKYYNVGQVTEGQNPLQYATEMTASLIRISDLENKEKILAQFEESVRPTEDNPDDLSKAKVFYKHLVQANTETVSVSVKDDELKTSVPEPEQPEVTRIEPEDDPNKAQRSRRNSRSQRAQNRTERVKAQEKAKEIKKQEKVFRKTGKGEMDDIAFVTERTKLDTEYDQRKEAIWTQYLNTATRKQAIRIKYGLEEPSSPESEAVDPDKLSSQDVADKLNLDLETFFELHCDIQDSVATKFAPSQTYTQADLERLQKAIELRTKGKSSEQINKQLQQENPLSKVEKEQIKPPAQKPKPPKDTSPHAEEDILEGEVTVGEKRKTEGDQTESTIKTISFKDLLKEARGNKQANAGRTVDTDNIPETDDTLTTESSQLLMRRLVEEAVRINRDNSPEHQTHLNKMMEAIDNGAQFRKEQGKNPADIRLVIPVETGKELEYVLSPDNAFCVLGVAGDQWEFEQSEEGIPDDDGDNVSDAESSTPPSGAGGEGSGDGNGGEGGPPSPETPDEPEGDGDDKEKREKQKQAEVIVEEIKFQMAYAQYLDTLREKMIADDQPGGYRDRLEQAENQYIEDNEQNSITLVSTQLATIQIEIEREDAKTSDQKTETERQDLHIRYLALQTVLEQKTKTATTTTPEWAEIARQEIVLMEKFAQGSPDLGDRASLLQKQALRKVAGPDNKGIDNIAYAEILKNEIQDLYNVEIDIDLSPEAAAETFTDEELDDIETANQKLPSQELADLLTPGTESFETLTDEEQSAIRDRLKQAQENPETRAIPETLTKQEWTDAVEAITRDIQYLDDEEKLNVAGKIEIVFLNLAYERGELAKIKAQRTAEVREQTEEATARQQAEQKEMERIKDWTVDRIDQESVVLFDQHQDEAQPDLTAEQQLRLIVLRKRLQELINQNQPPVRLLDQEQLVTERTQLEINKRRLEKNNQTLTPKQIERLQLLQIKHQADRQNPNWDREAEVWQTRAFELSKISNNELETRILYLQNLDRDHKKEENQAGMTPGDIKDEIQKLNDEKQQRHVDKKWSDKKVADWQNTQEAETLRENWDIQTYAATTKLGETLRKARRTSDQLIQEILDSPDIDPKTKQQFIAKERGMIKQAHQKIEAFKLEREAQLSAIEATRADVVLLDEQIERATNKQAVQTLLQQKDRAEQKLTRLTDAFIEFNDELDQEERNLLDDEAEYQARFKDTDFDILEFRENPEIATFKQKDTLYEALAELEREDLPFDQQDHISLQRVRRLKSINIFKELQKVGRNLPPEQRKVVLEQTRTDLEKLNRELNEVYENHRRLHNYMWLARRAGNPQDMVNAYTQMPIDAAARMLGEKILIRREGKAIDDFSPEAFDKVMPLETMFVYQKMGEMHLALEHAKRLLQKNKTLKEKHKSIDHDKPSEGGTGVLDRISQVQKEIQDVMRQKALGYEVVFEHNFNLVEIMQWDGSTSETTIQRFIDQLPSYKDQTEKIDGKTVVLDVDKTNDGKLKLDVPTENGNYKIDARSGRAAIVGGRLFSYYQQDIRQGFNLLEGTFFLQRVGNLDDYFRNVATAQFQGREKVLKDVSLYGGKDQTRWIYDPAGLEISPEKFGILKHKSGIVTKTITIGAGDMETYINDLSFDEGAGEIDSETGRLKNHDAEHLDGHLRSVGMVNTQRAKIAVIDNSVQLEKLRQVALGYLMHPTLEGVKAIGENLGHFTANDKKKRVPFKVAGQVLEKYCEYTADKHRAFGKKVPREEEDENGVIHRSWEMVQSDAQEAEGKGIGQAFSVNQEISNIKGFLVDNPTLLDEKQMRVVLRHRLPAAFLGRVEKYSDPEWIGAFMRKNLNRRTIKNLFKYSATGTGIGLLIFGSLFFDVLGELFREVLADSPAAINLPKRQK